jgi:hypothetical protein
MRPRRFATFLLVPVLVALAGCGGGAKDNGITKLSAAQVLAKTKAATNGVSSVHAAGSFSQSGQTFALNIQIGQQKATGTIRAGGGTIDLRLTGGTLYFRGDAKAFSAFGANAAQSSVAAGKWIKSAASSAFAASFKNFTDEKTLFSALLQPNGPVKKGGTTSVDGKKALTLVDTGANGGTLYVSETGAALPLRIKRAGGGGQIDFTDYNAGIKVSIPAGAVDVSQLGG